MADDKTPNHEAVLCANSCLSILKRVPSRRDSFVLYDCLEAIEMCTARLKTEAVQGDAKRDAGHLRVAEETIRVVKNWLKQVLYDQVPCYNDSSKHEELMVWSSLVVTDSKFRENDKPNVSQFDTNLFQERLHLNDL